MQEVPVNGKHISRRQSAFHWRRHCWCAMLMSSSVSYARQVAHA